MSIPLQLTLGVRELPRPKGEGYLYYKVSLSNEEVLLTYLSLNDLSDEAFSKLIMAAIFKLKATLKEQSVGEDCLQHIEFENMQTWAQLLVKEIVASG